MSTELRERVASIAKSGNRWKAVLAVPGQGMKGYYSAEVLKEDGPKAFPKGTKAWLGHALPDERNPLDLIGTYPDGAYFDENFDLEKYPEGVLVADLAVKNRFKEMIEDIGEEAELSIFCLHGDKDSDGNVLRMDYDRANSVDLVAYGGLEGSGLKEKLYESYSIPEDNSGAGPSSETSVQDNESKVKMDKELEAAFAALNARIDTLATGASAEAIAKAEADAKAAVETDVGAKVDAALAEYEEKVELIDKATELTGVQRESLKAVARKGEDVKPLIESYKAVVKDVRDTILAEGYIAPSGGYRVNETGASASENWSVAGVRVGG